MGSQKGIYGNKLTEASFQQSWHPIVVQKAITIWKIISQDLVFSWSTKWLLGGKETKPFYASLSAPVAWNLVNKQLHRLTTLIIHHSFIPASKHSFSVNPSTSSLLFLLRLTPRTSDTVTHFWAYPFLSSKFPLGSTMSSVLWHCWFGVRKSIRPVIIEWWGVGVVICLQRGVDCLHMIQLMPLASKNPIISCLI